MASYRTCPTCAAWVWFGGPHTCPPAWVVAPESYPEDMRCVYAVDAEQAAEKWAEATDCEDGEYYLASGNEMVVLVGLQDGQISRISVSGETVPSYRARSLGPAETDVSSRAEGSAGNIPPDAPISPSKDKS